MILLDTDHLTVAMFPDDARYHPLRRRMDAVGMEEFATTIVSVEEQMRGWLSFISRIRDIHQQTGAYDRLGALLVFLADWAVVPFDVLAADQFERLRKAKVRIGSQDLKIASVAFAHDALLLSANLRDFRQVPGLKVEDWLA